MGREFKSPLRLKNRIDPVRGRYTEDMKFIFPVAVVLVLLAVAAWFFPIFYQVPVDSSTVTCGDVTISATRNAVGTSRGAVRGQTPRLMFDVSVAVNKNKLGEVLFRGEPPPEYVERVFVLNKKVLAGLQQAYRETRPYTFSDDEHLPVPITFSLREVTEEDFEHISRCFKEHEQKLEKITDASFYMTFLTKKELALPPPNNTRYNVSGVTFSCNDGTKVLMDYGYLRTSTGKTIGQVFGDGTFIPVPTGQGGAISPELANLAVWNGCTDSTGRTPEATVRAYQQQATNLDN